MQDGLFIAGVWLTRSEATGALVEDYPTVERHKRALLDFPLGPAFPYAWPGGYPGGYLMDDGEYLCAGCMNDPSNPVHAGGSADGWRFEGLMAIEGSAVDYDGEVVCAHCTRVLVAA